MIDIALALILHPREPKVLIARRRKGVHLAEFWEFPGGKIEPGETAAESAVREAKEETGLDVSVLATDLEAVAYDYSDRSITLQPILCKAHSEDARPLASTEIRWVSTEDLFGIDFPPANATIVTQLQSVLPSAV